MGKATTYSLLVLSFILIVQTDYNGLKCIFCREHLFWPKNAISPLGGTDAVTQSAACIYSGQKLACPTNSE